MQWCRCSGVDAALLSLNWAVPLCNWPDLWKICSEMKQLIRNEAAKSDTRFVPLWGRSVPEWGRNNPEHAVYQYGAEQNKIHGSPTLWREAFTKVVQYVPIHYHPQSNVFLQAKKAAFRRSGLITCILFLYRVVSLQRAFCIMKYSL